MKTTAELINLLRRMKPVRQEAIFQTSVRNALVLHHFTHEAEHLLTPRHRIDFLVTTEEAVGIECKVTGASQQDTARQLIGYGRTRKLDRLILLTTKPMSLPIEFVEHDGRQIPITNIDISLNALL